MCAALGVRAARAQQPVELPRGPAYQLRLDLDLSVVLIAGATTSSFFFLDEVPGVACAPRCDRSRINALDRPAAGLYNPEWGTIGNVATAATTLLPIVVILADEGLVHGLNDDLVVAEAALVSSALQVTLSYAVARPRPRVYADEAPFESRSDANAGRSFFSGHVANTVATSVAALRTYQRLRRPLLGWTLLGIGLAGSSFVGVSRVVSGAHFPSDVMVGAAVGVGMGLALPALHDSPVRMLPYASRESSGLLLSGTLR
jgi:membrane-associated phospholipid phosphatase